MRSACGSDESLRNEVMSLLASHEKDGSFIDSPAYRAPAEILTNQQELKPGKVISHYRIISTLGKGGMGEVYLAEDAKLHRRVAIKFLCGDSSFNEAANERLLREAQAAAKLDHPNICAVHEVAEEDGRAYIVMAYVEGETLDVRMKRQRLELSDSLQIAAEVADAIAEAHAQGIIHRDIKPANVIITPRGQAKVMDFGLAQLQPIGTGLTVESEAPTAAFLTEPGAIIGTVPYMSPEQVQGQKLDARTDIFSFGVMVYEMLTGQKLFAAESPAGTISAILSKEPPPLTNYMPEVPAELERIVSKALIKELDERYQTAKDLLIDLRNLKRRLEINAEIKRTIPHELRVVSTSCDDATSTTPSAAGVSTAAAYAQHAPSSVEYIVSGLKRHKLLLISIAAITISVGAIAEYRRAHTAEVAIESIAVLPFENQNRDAQMDYLSDGISEALINSLTELPKLRVIARTTTLRFKGKDVDAQQVGRELNVRSVLTGRVQQSGDNLTVQVDLIDATTGSELWGNGYERKASDVLSVKQDIARAVTDKLRLRLSGDEQRQLNRRDTTNADAYQFYLKGRYYWNKRSPEALKKAIEQFQEALDRDPGFALGYVGLADCYVAQEHYSGIGSSETLPKARAAVDRALAIDDSLSEAHTTSASIYQRQWRWAETEDELKRAISLNPNYPTAHHYYAYYFYIKRQFDDAKREIKQAHELDPLSPVISENLAMVDILKGDIDSAIQAGQQTIDLDPKFADAHYVLAFAYLKRGRYQDATTEFQSAVDLSNRAATYLGNLGYCYALTGKRAEALTIAKELEDKYSRDESSGLFVAAVYAGLGDKDKSFAWLEKDFQQRSGQLPTVAWRPLFETLRSDSRYTDLLRRMRLYRT